MPQDKKKTTSTKRKGRLPTTEWTEYERAFWELCLERNWKPELDEDDSPILRPARTRDQKLYKVAMWAPETCDVTITAEHGKTVTGIKNKLERAKVSYKVFVEGESEAILLFPLERLPRVVKTLNLKKKARHPGPPKEALQKGQEALRRWREEQAAKKSQES